MDLLTINTEEATLGTVHLMIKTLGEDLRAPKPQGEVLIKALGENHRVSRAQTPGDDLVATQAHVESPLMGQEEGRHLGEPLMIHQVIQ